MATGASKEGAVGKNSYDADFYGWASEQAALLRAGRLDAADIEHIAEEIESLGRSEKRELVSRLTVLLVHLVKWRFQPEGRSPSWRADVKIQRRGLERHLDDNPRLKSSAAESARRCLPGRHPDCVFADKTE